MSNTAGFGNRSATLGEGGFLDELGRGVRQQVRVILALVFKDFRIQSTWGRLGLVWTCLRPGIRMSMISGMWFLLGRTEIGGVPVFLVVTAAIVPYYMTRNSLSSIPSAISSNRSLYGYRQVKPIDALLARFILEGILVLFSGLVMLFVFYWFLGIAPQFPFPLGSLGILGLTLIMTLGISLVAGVYSSLYEEVDRLLPMLRRPLFFISGVLYSSNQLPETARYILSWNPLAQISEHMRAYVLGMPLFPEADLTYTTIVSVGFLGWGMIAYHANRFKIVQR